MGLEMIDAGWLSILPPLIAILLALLSKEVYSSLFVGIFTGMCVYCFSTSGPEGGYGKRSAQSWRRLCWACSSSWTTDLTA